MTSLIAPTQHWALWAVLLSCAAFGIWVERTRWGAKLSGAVITILTAAVLSNLGVLPISAPAYEIVWSYFVPLAIPLLLFTADLRRIVREAGPMLLAFLAGALGTVCGVVVAYFLIPLGSEGWKLAAIFCATYVGGSLNYMAAAETVGLHSGDLLTAGAAADNLMMTLYFLVLFALPSIGPLTRSFSNGRAIELQPPTSSGGLPEEEERTMNTLGAAAALAIATVLCAMGYSLASILHVESGAILIITALAVGLATASPGALRSVHGADKLGMLFMQIFFAAIGASANIPVVLEVGPWLLVFAALILTVHLVMLLTIGRVTGVSLPEIVVASNANMGGPTTAAAMAAAQGWTSLVTPAILCGTLGYAIATFVGVLVGTWLGS